MAFSPINQAGYDIKNTKSMQDFQRDDAEFALKQQLIQAQIAKSKEFDLDKMGEAVLVKAAIGIPLSPQEIAVGQAYDAKRQSMQFNPVTGMGYTNKKAFEALGGQDAPAGGQAPKAPAPAPSAFPIQPGEDPLQNELKNNPKLRQDALEKYNKAKPGISTLNTALDDYVGAYKSADKMDLVNSVAGRPSTVSTAWSNAALLAKGDELFNLGVLNGPDLEIMRKALADPTTILGASAGNKTVEEQAALVKKLLADKLTNLAMSAGINSSKPPALPPAIDPSQEGSIAPALDGIASRPVTKQDIKKGSFNQKKSGATDQEIMEYWKMKAQKNGVKP